MIRSEPQSDEPVRTAQTQQIQANMRRIQRRQWWLWSSAVMVILVLGLGIASFTLPGLVAQAEDFYSFWLDQTVRGLVALVLLFSLYTVYQQLQIHRIQRQLTEQLDTLGRMEERTEEVYKLAILDPLTGLYNRRSGEQHLAQEISQAQRHIKQLTILLLDLNDLKHVNDRFGHAAGDDLIKYFAERLKRAIRGSDLAVRHGADEFLVLLPECKIEEVQRILDRLSTLSIDFDGQEYVPTFSAGWTNYIPGELPEELLRRADDALYINKRTRKEQHKPSTALA